MENIFGIKEHSGTKLASNMLLIDYAAFCTTVLYLLAFSALTWSQRSVFRRIALRLRRSRSRHRKPKLSGLSFVFHRVLCVRVFLPIKLFITPHKSIANISSALFYYLKSVSGDSVFFSCTGGYRKNRRGRSANRACFVKLYLNSIQEQLQLLSSSISLHLLTSEL